MANSAPFTIGGGGGPGLSAGAANPFLLGQAGAMPSYSETSTTKGNDWRTTTEGPKKTYVEKPAEVEADIAKMRQAGEKQVKALEQQKQTELELANVESKALQEQADWARYYELERQLKGRQQDDAIKARADAAAASRAEMEKALEASGKPVETPVITTFLLGLTGSGSTDAVNMYRDKLNRERQGKLDALAAAKEKHALSVGDLEGAKAAKEAALHDITNEEIAKTNVLAKQLEAMKKRFPAKAAQIDAQIAQLQGDSAEKIAGMNTKFAATITDPTKTTTQGGSQSTTDHTVTGEKNPNANAPKQAGREDVEADANLATAEAATARAKALIEENPSAWNYYTSQGKIWKSQEKLSNAPILGAPAAAGLELLGLKDQSFDVMLKNPKAGRAGEIALQIHKELEAAKTAVARAKGGAITKGDAETTESELGALGSTPEEMASTLNGINKRFTTQRKSLRANVKFQEDEAAAPAAAPPAAAPTPTSTAAPATPTEIPKEQVPQALMRLKTLAPDSPEWVSIYQGLPSDVRKAYDMHRQTGGSARLF